MLGLAHGTRNVDAGRDVDEQLSGSLAAPHETGSQPPTVPQMTCPFVAQRADGFLDRPRQRRSRDAVHRHTVSLQAVLRRDQHPGHNAADRLPPCCAHLAAAATRRPYSHSIVAGGLPEMS
jgi:hypothetical protein